MGEGQGGNLKKKKNCVGGGSGWGVRVDGNGEVKFFMKIKKKILLGGGWSGWGGGVRLGGGGGDSVDLNEELCEN